MKVLRALGVTCLFAAPAFGQATYSPQVTPDSLQAAITAATPNPCATLPTDTLNGSVGTGTPCMERPDRTQPTAVQAINTALAADCSWSVLFGRATVSSSPIVHASVVLPAGSTQPIPCSPIVRSTTGASGKCFPTQTSTLAAVTVVGISVAVGSQVINPTGTTCTAGMPVMVNVREPTQ